MALKAVSSPSKEKTEDAEEGLEEDVEGPVAREEGGGSLTSLGFGLSRLGTLEGEEETAEGASDGGAGSLRPVGGVGGEEARVGVDCFGLVGEEDSRERILASRAAALLVASAASALAA